MIAKTSELTKDLVKRESLMFQRYQVDAKDIKCVLEWWEKHESLFPRIGQMILWRVVFLPFDLIELIEINASLKEDLEEYEGELKQNEFEIYNFVIKF
jgi:hypothetical protein